MIDKSRKGERKRREFKEKGIRNVLKKKGK